MNICHIRKLKATFAFGGRDVDFFNFFSVNLDAVKIHIKRRWVFNHQHVSFGMPFQHACDIVRFAGDQCRAIQ